MTNSSNTRAEQIWIILLLPALFNDTVSSAVVIYSRRTICIPEFRFSKSSNGFIQMTTLDTVYWLTFTIETFCCRLGTTFWSVRSENYSVYLSACHNLKPLKWFSWNFVLVAVHIRVSFLRSQTFQLQGEIWEKATATCMLVDLPFFFAARTRRWTGLIECEVMRWLSGRIYHIRAQTEMGLSTFLRRRRK